MKLDYYHQNINVPVASPIKQRFKTKDLIQLQKLEPNF